MAKLVLEIEQESANDFVDMLNYGPRLRVVMTICPKKP